ncbi:MAG: RdgB/HAM1 family non-canonical purine NTP pyrophosphatase [Pyrinomonadaceae bacterium]
MKLPPPHLLIATHNQGKLHEFSTLLATVSARLCHLGEFPDVSEIPETGSTFKENANLKARGYCQQTGLTTLADDSGLEVEALNGAPGVLSARYGGPNATDSQRIYKLLDELDITGSPNRRARFICVVAIVVPGNDTVRVFRGTCEGMIATAPRGPSGFGYDPVFVPDGYEKTFGELPADVKQQISHRARAIVAAKEYLAAFFKEPHA